jgi:hypothetical protein
MKGSIFTIQNITISGTDTRNYRYVPYILFISKPTDHRNGPRVFYTENTKGKKQFYASILVEKMQKDTGYCTNRKRL